jgi:hypothetical protein
MNSAASSPSKKPLAPLVAALAIEAVSIDSASSSQQGPFEKVQDAANGFPATR